MSAKVSGYLADCFARQHRRQIRCPNQSGPPCFHSNGARRLHLSSPEQSIRSSLGETTRTMRAGEQNNEPET